MRRVILSCSELQVKEAIDEASKHFARTFTYHTMPSLRAKLIPPPRRLNL
ncbi:protein of unknown function [Maridesulfovibrio hydrothermalis AM13 = DSM 14728]|uniref:Uncharacterized protein n=1 Tax=Maridesulfovibrio hydrothermalis AM13 = DSM 14728 TaxID=1121451 RepID=L0R7P3_9BACT|nr:protein of unknown function [Maridesulfovibrio hydrothermalis AM13 = DSM 14728]